MSTPSLRVPFGLLVCNSVMAGSAIAGNDRAGPLRLTLPPMCYAVPGLPMSVYYDNVVLTERPEAYHFTVVCDLGMCEPRRWMVTPKADDLGDHGLAVSVADGERIVGEAKTTLRVVPADAGAGRETRLLLVGDSLTHASVYPNELARLLSLPRNPGWKMLGTHRPPEVAAGVAHEGYGGWTWQRFAAHYEPNPDGTYAKRSSPFVFLGADGKPVLDINRYFEEQHGGQRPDFATFLLGINDCFGANPEDAAAVDACVDAMFTQAETLLSAFRKAAPKAELGLCLVVPPNSREEGFEANYEGAYHRWGWKRIQHRLVERQLERFGSREAEHLFIVPTELNLDPVDGYPTNNGVHPNSFGYQQIATTMYAWVKARLCASRRK